MPTTATVAAIAKLTPLLLSRSIPLCTLLPPVVTLTLLPLSPSTTLPVLLSSTVTWTSAPSSESSNVPLNPATVNTTQKRNLESPVQAIREKGSVKYARVEMKTDPAKPARRPVIVTPPLVPRGTLRHGAVMRTGEVGDRIPSSLLRVSAAAAA